MISHTIDSINSRSSMPMARGSLPKCQGCACQDCRWCPAVVQAQSHAERGRGSTLSASASMTWATCFGAFRSAPWSRPCITTRSA